MTEASIRSFKTGDSSGMAGLIELCMQLTDK